jgi:16S rRNA C1402 N4-methylase RsmH
MTDQEFMKKAEELKSEFKKKVKVLRADYRKKVQSILKSAEGRRISTLKKDLGI